MYIESYDREYQSLDDDLINYIFSMTSIGNIAEYDRKKLFEFFEKKKDEYGVIKIPKEYGMFISAK